MHCEVLACKGFNMSDPCKTVPRIGCPLSCCVWRLLLVVIMGQAIALVDVIAVCKQQDEGWRHAAVRSIRAMVMAYLSRRLRAKLCRCKLHEVQPLQVHVIVARCQD